MRDGRTASRPAIALAQLVSGRGEEGSAAEGARRVARALREGKTEDEALGAAEREGQDELVAAETLPSRMGGDREILERFGFAFGAQVRGDPLFVHARLPPGWRKEATGHPMWSRVVDEEGRERARIFYKAAFYDRSASMSAVPRFKVEAVPVDGETFETSPRTARVVDGMTGAVVHEVTRGSGPDSWASARGNAMEAASEWVRASLGPHGEDRDANVLAWLDVSASARASDRPPVSA